MGTLTARALGVFLLLLLFTACTTNDLVDAPTQVLLRISSSDQELLSRATNIKVGVSSLTGKSWEDVPTISIETSAFSWPLDIPIYPRKGSDEARQFQVIIQAYAGDDLLSETRAVTRFERKKHKRLEVELYLCADHAPGFVCADADCRGELCKVCNKAGQCEPVGLLVDLPDDQPSNADDAGGDGEDGGDSAEDAGMDAALANTDAALPSGDAGVDAALSANDGGQGTDASMDSATPSDASTSADASDAASASDTGASNAGTDAGPEPCNPSTLTRCGQSCVNLSTSAGNCGRCGRSCRSNACSAGACAATSVYSYTPTSADAGTTIGPADIDPPFIYYQDPASVQLMRVTTSGGTPTLVSYKTPGDITRLRIDNGFLYCTVYIDRPQGPIYRMSLSSDDFVPITGTDGLITIPLGMTTNTNQVIIAQTLSSNYIDAIPKTGASGGYTLLASGPSLNGEVEADDQYVYIHDSAAIQRVTTTPSGTPPGPSTVSVFENGEVSRDVTLTSNRVLYASSQRVAIVPKTGGTPTTLAAMSAVTVTSDADNAYFVHGLGNDSCSGGIEIYRVPLSGGSATRLAVEPASCNGTSCCSGGLMQDSSALYWVRGDGLAIRRVEK